MKPRSVVLVCLMITLLACKKDSNNPNLDIIAGTYTGQVIFFKNYLDSGNNYMEESETASESLTIAIVSNRDGTLSFSGTGLLQNALEGWDDLVYDYEEDNIYNNGFMDAASSRDISIRLNPTANSIEFDYEERIQIGTSTEQINFIGVKN